MTQQDKTSEFADQPNRLSQKRAALRGDPGRGGCGIVAVAELVAPPSHELIRLALDGITRMEHRGGSLGDTGDGAGLLLRPERTFFERFLPPGRALPEGEALIVGTFFFLHADRNVRQHQRGVDAVLRRRGLAPLAWRKVPLATEALGARAREDAPLVYQLLAGPGHLAEDQLRLALYEAKVEIEELTGGAISVPSLSPRTTVYKVLGTAAQLARAYPDLSDPELTTRVALGHRRFATNTYSSWHLVQPFRNLAHNGEINTITANERATEDIDSALHFQCKLMPSGSDSAQLDRVVEMMSVHGMRDLAESLRRLIPPAWQEEARDPRERLFYEANARAMGTLGAWEGPSAIVATDGEQLVGLIDRMGLRPLRYAKTHSGRVVIASEMGAVPLDPAQIELDGQLEPGEMLVADLKQGQLILPSETSAYLIDRSQLDFGGLATEGLQSVEAVDPAKALSTSALNIFGWTRDRVRGLQATVKGASAPVRSMGNDLPLAIFSGNPSRLYSYLAQIVAVVTNPPIDPLREGGAMDTRVYLGRSPKMSELSSYRTWPQVELPHPLLRNEDVAGLLAATQPELSALRLDASFAEGAAQEGARPLLARLQALGEEARAAVREGVSILVLSDLEATAGQRLPVPMVLAVSVVHRALTRAGLRRNTSIVAETGEVHEGHDLAVLLSYGATAVNPYAMLHIAKETPGFSSEQAEQNLQDALVASLRRIMSKMGITSIAGYRGSALFEAIGLSQELVAYFLPDTEAVLGGLGIEEVYADLRLRARGAASDLLKNQNIPLYRKEITSALQLVARNGNRDGDYDRFVELLEASPPGYLRDLLRHRPSQEALTLSQVASAKELVGSTIRGAGMSHGALHSTAQRAIAAAFNHFGSFSNSGEGGEDERRNPGGSLEKDRSRSRQVASGRFGVDATYLMGAEELEIKIGQGAKPGEGGLLPADKVTVEIAAIRKVQPGVRLISPPPHHDIYSIEDLAQLITHLRQVNPMARVAVKVPSITNLGTIAVGIAKAGAQVITISGSEGGTGAAYIGSIKHAGLPLERGLADAHQHLVQAGIRDRVRLRADGGLKHGGDLAKVLALGADEVALGTVLMVAENCVFCRGCNKGNCPVGIATQDETMHRRFMVRGSESIDTSTPLDARYEEARAGVIRYLECLGEDLRHHLAALGLRHASELTGRVDLLEQIVTGNARWDLVDLGELLLDLREEAAPKSAAPAPAPSASSKLNLGLLEEAAPLLEAARAAALSRDERDLGLENQAKNSDLVKLAGRKAASELTLRREVDSCHHGIGATLAGELARLGRAACEGLQIRLETRGYAGQGLGFAVGRGLFLHHEGHANDVVGEVMSEGAGIVVVPPRELRLGATPHLVGNAVAYGATGGELYVAGRAGQRFGVRNSGARLVCEGAGKYAFEYMTGGVGLVLGRCAPCVGSGMTGGKLFLYDAEGAPRQNLSPLLADHLQDKGGLVEEGSEPEALLLSLLRRHAELCESPRAKALLQAWPKARPHFLHTTC